LAGKCLGEGFRLVLMWKVDAADILPRHLPEADDLEFRLIEPCSHPA
jgi:hypothetical protein